MKVVRFAQSVKFQGSELESEVKLFPGQPLSMSMTALEGQERYSIITKCHDPEVDRQGDKARTIKYTSMQ